MCYLADIKKKIGPLWILPQQSFGSFIESVWQLFYLSVPSDMIYYLTPICETDSRICWINILCHGVIWFPCQIRHLYDQPIQFRHTWYSMNIDICLLSPTPLAFRSSSVGGNDCCNLLKAISHLIFKSNFRTHTFLMSMALTLLMLALRLQDKVGVMGSMTSDS